MMARGLWVPMEPDSESPVLRGRWILETCGPINRRTDRPSLWTAAWIAVSLVICFLGATDARAQTTSPYAPYQSREVRRSAEQILASPEFRHFKRLKRGENGLNSNSGGSGSFPTSGGDRSRGSRRGSRRQGDNSDRATTEGSESDSAEADESSGDGGSTDGGDSGTGGGDPAETRGDSSAEQTGDSSSSSSIPMGGTVAGGLGVLFHLLAWVLLAVVVGFIIFIVIKAIQNYEGANRPSELTGGANLQGDVEPERPPGELPADVYLAQGRKLAAAGKYREAVAQLLLGAMSYIERGGLIRFRRGLTHHDYLRAVRGEKGLFAAMRAMIRVYEPLGFGRRTPAAEHFDQSLSRYERAFGTAPPGDS